MDVAVDFSRDFFCCDRHAIILQHELITNVAVSILVDY